MNWQAVSELNAEKGKKNKPKIPLQRKTNDAVEKKMHVLWK